VIYDYDSFQVKLYEKGVIRNKKEKDEIDRKD